MSFLAAAVRGHPHLGMYTHSFPSTGTGFAISFGYYCATAAVLYTTFSLLRTRKKFLKFYAPKRCVDDDEALEAHAAVRVYINLTTHRYFNDDEVGAPPPRMPPSLFGWAPTILSFSQLQVLHYAGMDGLTIVRVLNFGTCMGSMLGVCWVWMCVSVELLVSSSVCAVWLSSHVVCGNTHMEAMPDQSNSKTIPYHVMPYHTMSCHTTPYQFHSISYQYHHTAHSFTLVYDCHLSLLCNPAAHILGGMLVYVVVMLCTCCVFCACCVLCACCVCVYIMHIPSPLCTHILVSLCITHTPSYTHRMTSTMGQTSSTMYVCAVLYLCNLQQRCCV